MALMFGLSRPTPRTITSRPMKNSFVLPAASEPLPSMISTPPQNDRALLTDQPVRDPSAQQRQQVRGRDVQAVNRAGGLVVDAESAVGDRACHEQDQDRAHPVVGEPLPHLRHEQRRESARMTEELRSLGGIALDVLVHAAGPILRFVGAPCQAGALVACC